MTMTGRVLRTMGILVMGSLVASGVSSPWASASTTPTAPLVTSAGTLAPRTGLNTALPHAGPALGSDSSSNLSLRPMDTIDECSGGTTPPTGWNSVANAYWYGGAYGFVVDMKNIADFVAAENTTYGYMANEVDSTAKLDYFGAIACRESTFFLTATDGPYMGLFQLSQGDWVGILGSSCSDTAFLYSGCDGYAVWQTQMIAALYYCENTYGGNPYGGWFSEVFRTYW